MDSDINDVKFGHFCSFPDDKSLLKKSEKEGLTKIKVKRFK